MGESLTLSEIEGKMTSEVFEESTMVAPINQQQYGNFDLG